jgi:hypothetical protein
LTQRAISIGQSDSLGAKVLIDCSAPVKTFAWAKRDGCGHTHAQTLSGMAGIKSGAASKDLLLCLCRYIHKQANQPPQKQTSMLHSKIAGAYRCLLVWVIADDAICHDPEV